MKVLNIGSLNIDYVYQVSHIVEQGETISSTALDVFPGGKGLNQSIALARAGVTVYHAGRIGKDGQFLIDICKESGVDTRYIEVVEKRSGNAIIQVAANGQNSILLYPGANRCLDKEYINFVLRDFSDGDILVLQNEVNMLDYIIEEASKINMRIFLNPSPFNSYIENLSLQSINTFLMNEVEGYQLTNKKEPKEILEVMQQKYPNARVVLTLGSEGCYYQQQDSQIYQPSYKVNVVDTTAAGDTFTGYYIASMLTNQPVEKALLVATKAAALAVSRQGASSSIPYKEEIE